MSPTPPAADLPFDVDALERYLRQHVDGFEGTLHIARCKSGQSNPTFLLETPGRRYALRAKPAPKSQLLPSAHAVEREYRVQSALYGGPVPVARTYCLCEDETLVGRAFYVMDFVDGRVLWDPSLPGMTPAERGAIYAELNRVIADLHTIDFAKLGLGDYGKPGNYLVRQIERWTKQYVASRTKANEAMERLIDWLPRNVPAEENSQVTLVHGDYRLDNVIFHPTEPRILAVIDWELSTLGHPLADLAYYLMSWHITPGRMRGLAGVDLATLGIPDEAACVASYEKRVGRRVSGHWNFYLTYNLFRLAAIVQGIAKRVELGTASNPQTTDDPGKSPAADYSDRARWLAELGWRCAQEQAQ